MKFETQYTATGRERSHKFATVNNDDSMTQQSDANETDLNIIFGKFVKTGQLPQVTMDPRYGDFSGATDYRTALDKINELKDAFNDVPANIRARFHNDPGEFLEFTQNPDNIDEMVKLGLATERQPEQTHEYTASRRAYDDNTGLDDEPPPNPKETKNGNNPAANQRTTADQATRAAGGPPRGGSPPLR